MAHVAPLPQRLAARAGRHLDARARSTGRRGAAPPAARAGGRGPDRAAARGIRTVAAAAASRPALRFVHSHRRPLAAGDDHARPGPARPVGACDGAARARRRGRCPPRGSDRAGRAGATSATVAAVEVDVRRLAPSARTMTCIGAGLCLLLGLAWLMLLPAAPGRAQEAPPPAPISLEEAIGLVNTYCGACHQVPPPDILPKRDWPWAVQTMAELSEKMRGHEFIPADALPHIKAFYYGSSPTELPRLPYLEPSPSPVRFRASTIGATAAAPLVTYVTAGLGEAPSDLLVSDAGRRALLRTWRSEGQWHEEALAELVAPAHAHVADIDGDGRLDVVVAEMGEMAPTGEPVGKVVLLLGEPDGSF